MKEKEFLLHAVINYQCALSESETFFLIANACSMFLDDTGKYHLQVFNITANNFLLC